MIETSLATWRAGGRTVRHRGHEIFYRRGGRGEPLLILHGFPTASWDFHRLWPRLVRRFDVIAPDLIGLGFSARPRPYAYSVFDQADLVVGLLRRMGIDRVHLLAHDYGDTVAQELLAPHPFGPGACRGCARRCCSTAGCSSTRQRLTWVHRVLRSRLLGPPAQRLAPRWVGDRVFRNLFGEDSPPDAAELDACWRLAMGENGRPVLHEVIQYLRERHRHRRRWTRALKNPDVPPAADLRPRRPRVGGADRRTLRRSRPPTPTRSGWTEWATTRNWRPRVGFSTPSVSSTSGWGRVPPRHGRRAACRRLSEGQPPAA